MDSNTVPEKLKWIFLNKTTVKYKNVRGKDFEKI